MILIGNQLIASLKENLTFPGVDVRDFYSVAKISPPLVTLNEQPGEGYLFPDGKPRIVTNTYQVETYCRAMKLEGKTLPGVEACKQLMVEVCQHLEDQYGLTQVGDASFQPYVQDGTILRGIVRFRGRIDKRTEIIYQ